MVRCDCTLLMSGSDLLEHMVWSSLIRSVSSSENTDRPTGSLENYILTSLWSFEYIPQIFKYQFVLMKSVHQETNL